MVALPGSMEFVSSPNPRDSMSRIAIRETKSARSPLETESTLSPGLRRGLGLVETANKSCLDADDDSASEHGGRECEK